MSRWEAGELSLMEAGELLGMSERQFRRYRGRYEDDGAEGLVDRRVGKPSPKRAPAADARRPLELYGDVYRGWNVKRFHEHTASGGATPRSRRSCHGGFGGACKAARRPPPPPPQSLAR